MEFDESQKGAKNFMDLVKKTIEKNSIPVINFESFSLLGKDMKNYPV